MYSPPFYYRIHFPLVLKVPSAYTPATSWGDLVFNPGIRATSLTWCLTAGYWSEGYFILPSGETNGPSNSVWLNPIAPFTSLIRLTASELSGGGGVGGWKTRCERSVFHLLLRLQGSDMSSFIQKFWLGSTAARNRAVKRAKMFAEPHCPKLLMFAFDLFFCQPDLMMISDS